MSAVFIRILNMSMAASWLILAVIILRALFKRIPKWIRCILWGMAAVRLICPFSVESVLSLIPSAETIERNMTQHFPKLASEMDVSAVNNVVNPVMNKTPAPEIRATPLYSWVDIAEIVWLIGVIVVLAYALVSYLRLHRKVSEAVCLRGNVWIGDMVKTPFVLGIIHPRIYLSSSMEENQMPYVLVHEQAHLSRKDHWWKWLGYLLLAVYWFNPLCWAAYILFCRDIELACDEKVICGWDEKEKRLYSHALLSCSIQQRVVMSYPLAFGEIAVKERIKSVLFYKKPGVLVLTVSLCICILVAFCFLTDPVKGNTESDNDSEVEWWTYDEYAKWLENEKEELSKIIGTRSWTPSTGWYTWTQERVDETIALYEEILQQIKDGYRVSKSVNGSEDVMLMQGTADYMGRNEMTAVDDEYTSDGISEEYIAELLNAYQSFGLTYDEAEQEMSFKGKLVRYFYDGVDIEDGAAIIYEFLNEEGVVDIYTVRKATENNDGSTNPVGVLEGIEEYSQKEFDSRDIKRMAQLEITEAIAVGNADSKDGQTFEEIFSKYIEYGIVYVESVDASGKGNVYYNGQLVNLFSDVTPDGGAFSFQSKDKGNINVRTVYNSEKKIIGIEIVGNYKQ